MTEVMFEKMADQIGETMGSQFRLAQMAQKARRLKGKGRKLPKGFQLELESIDPNKVGLNQEASDAFSPEELVELFAHPRKVVDWDRLEEINYFYEGDQ